MKRLGRWAIAVTVFFSGFYFLGDRQDRWLWAYLTVFMATALYALMSIDEDLASERFNPPDRGADRLHLRTIRLIALAHMVIGLLDNKYKWTAVPLALRPVGIAGMSLCFVAMVHAMRPTASSPPSFEYRRTAATASSTRDRTRSSATRGMPR
jgi:hypothetical protein